MALPTTTTALRSIGCHSCRQWALRSFITSIGGPSSIQATPQRRSYFRTPPTRNEARERMQQDDDHVLNGINDIAKLSRQEQDTQQEAGTEAEAFAPDVPPEHPPEASSSVPWYLQVQQQPTEQQRESPMAARQRIPALPDHPPSLLQPLLSHVSVELGMDDLTLLDLRPLDPPPALGANLLMLIGTARSEKHLHVSADRLCRWLRTEYKLTPSADGLLGRNELKLKLRRRAKRTKLMSAVGARTTAETELDEGIRTGWVCVNVGRVEGGELPEQQAEAQRREQGVVGFGTSRGGSNIVVQMLTEEKRGEVDLERLWTGILNRSRREREKALEPEAELVEGEGEEGEEKSVVMQELDGVGMASSVGSVQREAGMGA